MSAESRLRDEETEATLMTVMTDDEEVDTITGKKTNCRRRSPSEDSYDD